MMIKKIGVKGYITSATVSFRSLPRKVKHVSLILTDNDKEITEKNFMGRIDFPFPQKKKGRYISYADYENNGILPLPLVGEAWGRVTFDTEDAAECEVTLEYL